MQNRTLAHSINKSTPEYKYATYDNCKRKGTATAALATVVVD